MTRRILKLGTLLTLALLASSQNLQAAAVAYVGAEEISEQDIADWQVSQKCYGEDAIVSRKAGFMRMFEASILAGVLAGQGRPITPGEHKKERRRIDAETRAPDILSCIKKHFGQSTARYEKIFVRPILAQRFIREFVKQSPKVQAGAYRLRDRILKDIAKQRTFKNIALAGATYSSATYFSEQGPAAAAAAPWKQWSPFEAEFINAYLKDLKPGETRPKPIEDELTIKFVRLLNISGAKYDFESLTVQKLSTEDYLKNVKKLRCRINDTELRDWAASIKGNPLLAPAEITP